MAAGRRDAFGAQPDHTLPFQFVEYVCDTPNIEVIALLRHSPSVVVLEFSGEQTGRRCDARVRRYDHRFDSQKVGDIDRVHRPGAAIRYQGEISRVVAALDTDVADGSYHSVVCDSDDPTGGGGQI